MFSFATCQKSIFNENFALRKDFEDCENLKKINRKNFFCESFLRATEERLIIILLNFFVESIFRVSESLVSSGFSEKNKSKTN